MGRRGGRALIVLCLFGAAAAAQTPSADLEQGVPPQDSAGLLRWTALTGDYRYDCTPVAATRALPLYAEAEGSRLLGQLLSADAEQPHARGCQPARIRHQDGRIEELPTRESGYEEIALIAGTPSHGRIPLWLGSEWGWAALDPEAEWLPFERLLPQQLTYLSDAFDGTLCSSAAAHESCLRLAAGERQRERPVRILAQAWQAGELWYRVELLDAVCSESPETVLAQGWIRALPGQRSSVWFWSRGC